jgi:hypothetical protein
VEADAEADADADVDVEDEVEPRTGGEDAEGEVTMASG